MSATDTTLKVTLNNVNPLVKPLNYTQAEFPVSDNIEGVITIKSSDGPKQIALNNFGNFKKIFILPQTGFTCTLRLNINDGMNPAFDVDVPVNGILVWDLDSTYGTWIQNIKLLTSSASPIDVEFRVYSN